ncbi:P-loop NTPase fold protein [Rhizobium ruizarguesonis]
MALVFDSRSSEPGIHALIIGPGSYVLPDGSPDLRSDDAAVAVATRISQLFPSADVPLASLHVLASTAAAGSRAFETLGQKLELDRPKASTVQAAIEAWMERLDKNKDDVALFYFCGLGSTERSEKILYLDDDISGSSAEAGDPRAISLTSLTGALSGLQARCQIILLDTCEVRARPRTSQIVLTLPMPPDHFPSQTPPQDLDGVIVEADYGPDFAEGKELPPFTSTLIFMLDRASSEQALLTVREVVEAAQRRPQSAGDTNIGLPDIVMRGNGEIAIFVPNEGTTSGTLYESIASPLIADQRPSGARSEGNTEFIMDDAEYERDDLGRSVLAIGLARRLHRIWRRTNLNEQERKGEPSASFVAHIDAPWGGGKTTFANFIERVLNPRADNGAYALLRNRYTQGELGGIYLEDPPSKEEDFSRLRRIEPDGRRPWIVVNFNAWQAEHCSPPWWVFYQTVRKKCFDAALKEGTDPWSPGDPNKRLNALKRPFHWASLWMNEYRWRLTNPKVVVLLGTAAISAALLLLMRDMGYWGIIGDPAKAESGYFLSSSVGLLLAGLTGGSAIWGLGAVLTESLVPGTDTLSERLSLGNGDPFGRFRRHFHNSMQRLRRPILVVIDDLDRCKPSFVVDLVRGLQTLLRSPRVVFLILGDRDWIERAFESQHADMGQVRADAEQTLGARFVEKAIQMSFVLPLPEKDDQSRYVKAIMLGTNRSPTPADRQGHPELLSQVRTFTNKQAMALPSSMLEVTKLVQDAKTSPDIVAAKGSLSTAEFETVVAQAVGDTVAINAAVNPELESAVSHELQELSEFFPPNPRQIKRIINAITIYWAVALQRPRMNADALFRQQLAVWIILMTEWPKTWRLFVSDPDLIDVIKSDDPVAALVSRRSGETAQLADTAASEIRRIRSDEQLLAILNAKHDGIELLTTASAKILAELTPIYPRSRRTTERLPVG